MNTLTPAQPGSRSSSGSSSTFSRVPPMKKAKSQYMRSLGARRPCRPALSAVVVGGLVLGISKTAVTPPATAARLPVSRSSLCSSAGLAEMHLGVDDAGQDVQARGNRWSRRRHAAEHRRSPAIRPSFTAMSRTPDAVVVDDGRAFQNEIIGGRHCHRSVLEVPAAALRKWCCESASRSCNVSDSDGGFQGAVLATGRCSGSAARIARRSCRAWSRPMSRGWPRGWRYAALLTPQGKILFDFFCAGTGRWLSDRLCGRDSSKLHEAARLLQAPGAGEHRAVTRNMAVARAAGRPSPRDRRSSSPIRALPISAAASSSPNDHVDRSMTMALRLSRRGGSRWASPTAIEDIGSGELFPHEANLDQLGGVSFTKGCYVGQEVVSRMEHRGTARNRILPVAARPDRRPRAATSPGGGRALGAGPVHRRSERWR